ncbi:translocation/assembly module TamB domain-containing protein [Acidicapsa ligni]|uniref:translocation/assembly module TamB domain-containing protein n=1 Tax=Acidicapsa ligni TaxID=542300 RepID=UPI0021DF4E14|nr:translocation/assembly module TamB [Acidicapsa ligni]
MTTPETPQPLDSNGAEQEPVLKAKSGRRRRKIKLHWTHHTMRVMGVFLLVLVALVGMAYFFASSAAFEDGVRLRLISELESATGGRVEISHFRWNLLKLRIEADGITIHGLEAASEAPYAHVDRLRVEAGILGLFVSGVSPHVVLHSVEIQQPSFHLIVYPDGTTNQPHPHGTSKSGKSGIDTLFDARIGHLSIEHGVLHIANQEVPLDLQAQDASIQLAWLPGVGHALASVTHPHSDQTDGSYRIALGLGELAFSQGKFAAIPSRLDAKLVLFHNSVQLDELHLIALDRTLILRGRLTNFAHPAWQAQANGQIDLRILASTTGFVGTPGGIVTLNGMANGHGSSFDTNGDITGEGVHYKDDVVDAQTATFAAHFHADPAQLLVSAIRTRLVQGGDVQGEFQYDNWLDSTPTPAAAAVMRREHKTWPVPTGTVRANLSGISLDTVLVMLASPEYRKLGLDTFIAGPARASWTGLGVDLAIGGQLALAPSTRSVPGEAPLHGSVDAMYHEDTGSVSVANVVVHTPHSSVEGKGSLGVYPITRASAMDLDFQSTDLSEFDAVLRTLGLKQGNRVGVAALPVSLKGMAQFHGQLNSSWITPHVEGHLSATNIGIEIPPASSGSAPDPDADSAPLQYMHWDSIDLDALYTPASIVVHHGVLNRGVSSLTLQGELDADDPNFNLSEAEPEFDHNAVLSLKADARQFSLDELLPMAGVVAPVSGKLNAQIDVQGALNALTGSGSIEVNKAIVFGESIEHVKATGSISGQQLKISNLTAQQGTGHDTGSLTGSGSYDLAHHKFSVDARAAAIELGSLQELKRAGVAVTGKLGFTLSGDGTVDDPHLQSHAVLSSMSIASQPVADLMLSASTRDRSVIYDLSSHQATGDFTAHGQTSLNAAYETKANVQFSKFDIGALLKLLRVTGINGQSDLEGTATLSGPLAHLEKMSGDASLKQLAVSVEGVNLQSRGAVHAALSNGIARLDPVEITGEGTDLKLNGTLGVTGKQQLDLQASGSVNLHLAESLDPDLSATGITSFQMEAHGPVANPILQGKVQFQNASVALQDFPNGLSQIQGTLEFIQNRLEVRSLTAVSGGGQLSVTGYLGFQRGLYADLTATGKGIRIRYPQGVSSLADAKLRLQGPQSNLLLSGNVEVTRFAISSDMDVAAFASANSSVQPIVPADAPSNHIRLDVHLTSAPQLNFQNALAKLAGDVDLHIRGTLASPSVLGRISLTEGSASVGGTKYELQRGDITFSNPVRIQPNIDIDATARVEDYDITLGLHGTTDKPKLTYRSEPPLPEADVIALLALGRTQDEQRAYSQQQQQAGDNPMTDALLGGALNATVSNRVQRLFGTGAIKVDPNFIGSLGNSTARVTVVEQIGNNLTFTYASNVNTTSQQLIQAEIAVNRHVSLLVTQDESGIFSVVVKTRRRYK